MLNRILAVLSLVVFASRALALDAPSSAHEAIVNFTADNPHAMLEILDGHSDMQLRTAYGIGAASTSRWTPLCYTPCHVSVKLVDELRVSGDGIQPSSSMLVDPGATELNVRARTGSSGTHIAGVVLLMLGGGTALMGGSLLAFGATTPSLSSWVPAGVITLGAGATLGIVGALLMGFGGSTSLELEGGREGTRTQTPMLF